MARHSGGVAAAFGFRYQYLITVELLLELFENSGTCDWVVDVDRAEQDSADIIVRGSASAPPERVIQVKASLPESSTTIGVTKVRKTFEALAEDHPAAAARELVTNRRLTPELESVLAAEGSAEWARRERFRPRDETLNGLTETLLRRIRRLRSSGVGGLGADLHYLLLRQLVDMVHEAGSRPIDQHITREVVRGVLEGPAPVLADALGARRWGMCIQVPTGDYIERPAVTRFLDDSLPSSAVYDGTPRVAVVHGISGTGKTSAACLFARSRLEQVAFVLWLDASSPEVLESQLPVVLEQMGSRDSKADPTTKDLIALLGELPVPWLLVLDGAQSLDDTDAWVPRSGYGQTLITTTRADWPKEFAPALRLDEFSRSEVRVFFAERFDQPESMWSPEQLAACDEIANRLSNWPLALELAVGWIQRRGSSLEAMQRFAERVERLNLDDPHLLPHGYPRTASRVVIDLWTELSSAAQRLVSALLVLGGDRVPVRLITEWAQSLDLWADDPLEELFAMSIIQRGINTGGGTPHDYDETVNVHDFIKLVAGAHGVEMDTATIDTLIETCEQSLAALAEEGRFREGATLVRPVDQLLRQLVENMRDDTRVLIRLSVLMHNLAQVAVLTSNVALSQTWFVVALNVRRTDPGRFERNATGVRLQLQTLAGAAMAMARRHDVEELKSLTQYASDLVERAGELALDDPQTLDAIKSLRVNVGPCILPEGAEHFAALLRRPLPEGGASRNVPLGSDKVARLHDEMALATRLIETEDWQRGVTCALAASNHALEENLLVDWIVDGLLDVGLLLVTSIARRQHDLPEGLLGCLQRVAAWFRENPAHLEELQEQRLRLLQSIATGKPSSIRAAVATLPGQEELAPMVLAWSQLASMVSVQLDRFRRYERFTDLPEAVTIDVGVNGGDDINVWQTIESSDGTPVLWVCTASRVRYDSRGRTDPVREEFTAAGLPQNDLGDSLQRARGWSATLHGDALTINDRDGISRVIVSELETEFCARIRALDGLVLAYGDFALVTSDQGPPPLGWVSLAVNSETLHDVTATSSSHGLVGRCRNARWLQRVLIWWKRNT